MFKIKGSEGGSSRTGALVFEIACGQWRHSIPPTGPAPRRIGCLQAKRKGSDEAPCNQAASAVSSLRLQGLVANPDVKLRSGFAWKMLWGLPQRIQSGSRGELARWRGDE